MVGVTRRTFMGGAIALPVVAQADVLLPEFKARPTGPYRVLQEFQVFAYAVGDSEAPEGKEFEPGDIIISSYTSLVPDLDPEGFTPMLLEQGFIEAA